MTVIEFLKLQLELCEEGCITYDEVMDCMSPLLISSIIIYGDEKMHENMGRNSIVEKEVLDLMREYNAIKDRKMRDQIWKELSYTLQHGKKYPWREFLNN